MTAGEASVTAPVETIALRRVPWRWSDLAIGVGVIGLFQVVAAVVQARHISIPRSIYWSVYFVPLLAWTALYPLFVARRRLALPLFQFPSPWQIVVEVVAAAVLTFVMAMAIGMLILFWQTIFQREYPSQGPFGDARGAPLSSLLVYAFLGATIGPVCEEMFMRGFVYNALRQRLGIVVAMILQAALFALLHPFAIAQRIVVFGVGVALGSIYEWRKTLLTPILVHCFFNTFVMAFGLLAVWRTPYLGVTAVPQHEGCRITSVFAGSPAAKAGIEVDDVLVNCDGRPVHSFEDIAKYVTEHRAGDVIDLQVLRDHQSRVMHAILERRPLQ